ncbi:TonB-dependent receptor [Marinobacterium arenosum]|uniref:TonB-dependent receptor n=1 Tax=Marinobacterium arenosum TaxID=2862496 RepID=UPI001C954C00|nr:TonB-dependent receptor [Marinobacterium arenosum]MBY4677402.1 TonB-dependent receptor [Marinobacterium arenosum]
MKTFRLTTLAGAMLMAQGAFAQQPSDSDVTEMTAVVVTGEFREAELQEIPNSISVIDQQTINARGAEHLEDVLGLAPNVNFAGGSSRARFYQIRGIGERSQFVEPLNPSVGVLVDGIDMSGIGSGATLLDVQQVEVFRGPQGTLFGANALAGLINIKSNDPTDYRTGSIETTLGNYDTYSVKGVLSGPISDRVGYRLALQSYGSDGYISNDFLDRDDTNDRDEQTLRGKLRIEASEDLTIDLTALLVDIDNGYDAFSLDNTRHTLSDEPGHDRQETAALAFASSWSGNDSFLVETSLSFADSDLEYGYDEDWTFDGFHPFGYSSTDNYIRDRQTATGEIRLVSRPGAEIFNGTTQWVAGVYLNDQSVDLTREYTFNAEDFTSKFDSTRTALYGQLETWLSDDWTLTTGLRVERWDADYRDSDGVSSDPSETLWGGRVALDYMLNDDTILYGLISRGYKAGGFNSDGTLPEALRTYDTEYMWNYETGVKGSWLDNRLQTQLALFYQQRRDVQIKGSRVVTRDDGSSEFIDFIDNSSEGTNYGIELEANLAVNSQLTLFGALGWLQTDLQEEGASWDGRQQAHAPNYQFLIGAHYDYGNGWYARVDLEGKDEFYFSDRHNAESDAYELLNARIGYRTPDWELSLWGRNLTDEDYYVRGFGSFGNDPRKDYVTEPYYQFGDPRLIGVTAKLMF